ncbi:ChbG/HpnK family deacetylase [Chryseobacterium taklimakanense]|uniref:ChbG/HpnK family deacetylase n=2 Tax=Chryseobacterium taklimakanense TaxID=536441 RepID=A0A3G8WJ54_9FLAO|nr:ChbG/HpnK family deacetylase [Chryseobacterium taklimakanense]
MMKKNLKLIINADDLGLTRGINKAILHAHHNGFLSHASIIAGAEWYQHAIEEVVKKSPELKIGVHLNLTCEKQCSAAEMLGNKEGVMKSSFIQLLLKPKSAKFLKEVEQEFEAQINTVLKDSIKISHLDGHEHIHIIPSFNKIVKKLAKKYKIPRVREINESFFGGIAANRSSVNFENILKWILLRFLSLFNENEEKVKFHSIFSTCKVNDENLAQSLENNQNEECLEIMVHPAISDDYEDGKHLDSRFREFLKAPERLIEYEVCFNQKLKEYDLA